MSEFRGSCFHLVQSNGYCEECKKKVRIVRIDGMTSAQMDYRDEQEDEEECDDRA